MRNHLIVCEYPDITFKDLSNATTRSVINKLAEKKVLTREVEDAVIVYSISPAPQGQTEV